jgi:hypothetical protein
MLSARCIERTNHQLCFCGPRGKALFNFHNIKALTVMLVTVFARNALRCWRLGHMTDGDLKVADW